MSPGAIRLATLTDVETLVCLMRQFYAEADFTLSERLASRAFVQSIREAGDVLSRFGPVRWLRPGSGWYNHTMLDAIEQEGYRCALGSVYPYDGRGMPARIAAAYILANTRPGAVIILHEGKGRGPRTVAVLNRVLPALRARGYRVVTLSELFRPSS